MNDALGAILIQKMPAAYDANAVDNALFNITQQLERMVARGRVLGEAVNITNLPTSTTDLAPGDLWRDAGDNSVHVVPVTGSTDGLWVDAIYQNNWTDYASGFYSTQYRSIGNNMVQLRGLVKKTTAFDATPIFTLPVGFRPTYRVINTTTSNAALARCDILANGDVEPTVGAAAWFSLDNIIFSTN